MIAVLKLWITRSWAVLRAAPWLLMLLATAAALAGAARRRERRADALGARADDEMRVLGTPERQAQYIENQNSAINRAIAHADAAQRIRARADQAALSLARAGHPSAADLVRRWNREQP